VRPWVLDVANPNNKFLVGLMVFQKIDESQLETNLVSPQEEPVFGVVVYLDYILTPRKYEPHQKEGLIMLHRTLENSVLWELLSKRLEEYVLNLLLRGGKYPHSLS
jgi:hypothetical protein